MKFIWLGVIFGVGAFSLTGAATYAAGLATGASLPFIEPAPLDGARNLGSAADSRIDFSVVLPYRHAADLRYLLEAQKNPASKYYRRFLNASEFRNYFSPTEATYAAVATTLERAGFTIETFANRTVLHAYGKASDAARYFNTTINIVRQTDGRLAYANIARATIPPAIAGARVVGLSSIIRARPASEQRVAVTGRPAVAGPLFGPDGGFGPLAIAKAENFPIEHGYRGVNSNVADVIDGVVADSDVATFLRTFGLIRSGPRTTKISVDGGCGAACGDGRAAVRDAEWILGMAPSASLFTYQIPSLAPGAIVDGFNAIASDDAVNIVHFAVGSCEINGADLELAIAPIIAQGAAEGITYETVAFGGANLCGLGTLDLPMTPANLDTVTAVGGSSTFVATSGQELAASTFSSSNGGVSVVIPLPTWQAGTPGVAAGGRNVPDVVVPSSVDGVGPSVYYGGQWQGGNAFVNNAPFAGYLATVQEMYGYATPIGNIAPALYASLRKFGYSSGGTNYFTDIALGCIGAINNLPVCAEKNYDVASGIGSISDGFALAKSFALGPIVPPVR